MTQGTVGATADHLPRAGNAVILAGAPTMHARVHGAPLPVGALSDRVIRWPGADRDWDELRSAAPPDGQLRPDYLSQLGRTPALRRPYPMNPLLQ